MASIKKAHSWVVRYWVATVVALGASLLLQGGVAQAQTLTVLPVSIIMAPGQLSATLTVINQGTAETSVQVRALVWTQPNGIEQLAPSDTVIASPPIATIAPNATQVVRLILRQTPQGREATYRVLLDQIPPPAAPGMVRISLRLSIPVFAEPATRVVPQIAYHLEDAAGVMFLVVVNTGNSHDTLRNITLTTSDGVPVKIVNDGSPYILAGATRRWNIQPTAGVKVTAGALTLKALSDSGPVNQQVAVASAQ